MKKTPLFLHTLKPMIGQSVQRSTVSTNPTQHAYRTEPGSAAANKFGRHSQAGKKRKYL